MAELVCPWWLGYFLASPIRKLYQNPEKILAPYVKSGMTVLEIGPGMGFFTIPLARMAGQKGKIICPDIQEKMLRVLNRKARRVSLENRVVTRIASTDSLNIDDFAGRVDFVLAFAVMHEIPNHESLFGQIFRSMKDGARILISEPSGHVSSEGFAKMLDIATRIGFKNVASPSIRGSLSVVLEKT